LTTSDADLIRRYTAFIIQTGISIPGQRGIFEKRQSHKTGDLYFVQRALGHRQITTTEVHKRTSDLTLRRVVVN